MGRRTPPRLLTVVTKKYISRNLLRITFGGENLIGFPSGSETASVKLLLAHPDQDWDSYLAALAGIGEKPLKRTYTVLAYRQQTNELDIDIALHDNPGPATRWAIEAQPGDCIALAGPGNSHLINTDADWFLLAGDMAALPAIVANIQTLPDDARGYIVIEVIDPSDCRELQQPSMMKLEWVVNPEPGCPQRPLVAKVKSLEWLDGTPSAWIAGESDTVRDLRQYLSREQLLESQHRFTSGYWKLGDNEDSFQAVKRPEYKGPS